MDKESRSQIGRQDRVTECSFHADDLVLDEPDGADMVSKVIPLDSVAQVQMGGFIDIAVVFQPLRIFVEVCTLTTNFSEMIQPRWTATD